MPLGKLQRELLKAILLKTPFWFSSFGKGGGCFDFGLEATSYGTPSGVLRSLLAVLMGAGAEDQILASYMQSTEPSLRPTNHLLAPEALY